MPVGQHDCDGTAEQALLGKGELSKAYDLFYNAYEIHSKLLEENPDDTALVLLTADDLMGMAEVLGRQQNYEEAIENGELAMELRTGILQADATADQNLIPRMTKGLTLIANMQLSKGDPDEAADTYEKAITLYKETLNQTAKTDLETHAILLENLISILHSFSTLQVKEGELVRVRKLNQWEHIKQMKYPSRLAIHSLGAPQDYEALELPVSQDVIQRMGSIGIQCTWQEDQLEAFADKLVHAIKNIM